MTVYKNNLLTNFIYNYPPPGINFNTIQFYYIEQKLYEKVKLSFT